MSVKCKISFIFRPDLIQYEKLQKSNALYNLNNSFEVAEDKLGLTRLLDPEGNSKYTLDNTFMTINTSGLNPGFIKLWQFVV